MAQGDPKATLGYSTETVRALRPARVIQDKIKQGFAVTSLAYDQSGEYIAANDEETLHLYNARTGIHLHSRENRALGFTLTRFTHAPLHIIHATPRQNDFAFRYLDARENVYIRVFPGHKAPLTSLEVSPVNDTVVSGALDGTARLWDLRSKVCQVSYNIGNYAGYPVTSGFDPTGVSIGIATSKVDLSADILLYDVRMANGEPFAAANIDTGGAIIKNMRFSPTGQHLALGTTGQQHILVDAFDVDKIHGVLTENSAPPVDSGVADNMAWSPDGKYILRGTSTQTLAVWDIANTAAGPVIDRDSAGGVFAVGANPAFFQVATGGPVLTLWQPDRAALGK